MDEELIILPTEEVIEANFREVVETEVEPASIEKVAEAEEIVKSVEVELPEETNIEIEEAVGWIGGDSTRHYSLFGREESNQHPIEAITGLRKELDDIEALQVIYSNEKNQADYYLWQDENLAQENRVGYFVAIGADTNQVKLCTESDDIFGVTVNTAAFIGGQSDLARDYKYGLVAHNGMVAVRCESDVKIGDTVVTNNYGYARQSSSGYGYKVIEIQNINGVPCALISLNISANQVNDLMQEVQSLDTRMEAAEINIISAVNVANGAYNKATETNTVSEEAIKKALEALDKSNVAIDNVDKVEEAVLSSNQVAVEAKTIANLAIATAETIHQDAVATADSALTNVNALIDELEPITKWTYSDPTTGEVFEGAEYFTTYINNNLATKLEVQTVETLTQHNTSAIEKNAKGFQSFVSSIDKYSVGEYSQAYGLTLPQAKTILDIGVMYIPIESHSEEYTYIDQNNQKQIWTQNFTKTYYYTWGGDYWIESESPLVVFSEAEPVGGQVLKYWYIDSNNPPDGYDAHSLYIWNDEQREWIQVNILAGNVNNRIVSIAQQTANEFKAEVTNARGSAVSLGARLNATDAEINNITSWSLDDNGERYNLATIQQKADDASASVSIVVAEKDGEKVVNAASIVTAINDSGSSVTLEGDHIILNGATTNGNGTFSISTDGHMTASGGSIGGWTINGSSLYKNTNSMTSTKAGTYIGTDGIRQYKNANAYVNIKDGVITARGADIQGNITANGVIIKNTSGQELLNASNNRVKISNFYTTNNSLYANADGSETWSKNGVFICTGTATAYSIGGSASTVNGWCFGAGGNFGVTNQGHLYCTQANIQGTIKADKGYVGSWMINEDELTSSQGPDGNAFFLHGNPEPTAHWMILKNTDNEVPFCVNYDGTVHATRLNLGWNNTTIEPNGNSTQPNGIILRVKNNEGVYQAYTSWTESGIHMYKGNDTFSLGTLHDYGLYLKSDSGRLAGTWTLNNAVAITSDVNAKHAIELMPDTYSTLFDNLNPVIYKYNDGTSNRYHTGFIAQDVKSALDIAGIATSDFAGICIPTDDSQPWTLRYEEFVSLNTWQIQKAKERISELEEKVAQLEKLINKN